MSHTVLLIGAGQLGSRHLQGLARSSLPLRIDVVDPSPEALAVARSRFEEVSTAPDRASYHTSLPAGRSYAVVIVATDSGPRAAVTESVLSGCEAGAIVFEKVLFTRPQEYDRSGERLAADNVPAWVNCPRRLYPLYHDLRPVLTGPVRIAMQGGMWGLGCNSIHIVDLAAWLSGQTAFTWDASGLDPLVHDSHRRGYVEFSGVLTASAPDGSSVQLYARNGSTAPPQLSILAGDASAVLDEVNGSGVVYRKDRNYAPEPVTFRLPYQSELSHLVVEAIVRDGTCPLPDFASSARLHLGMIGAFLDHLGRLGRDPGQCPIT